MLSKLSMRVGDYKGWFSFKTKGKASLIMYYYRISEYYKNDDRDHGMLIVSSGFVFSPSNNICLY